MLSILVVMILFLIDMTVKPFNFHYFINMFLYRFIKCRRYLNMESAIKFVIVCSLLFSYFCASLFFFFILFEDTKLQKGVCKLINTLLCKVRYNEWKITRKYDYIWLIFNKSGCIDDDDGNFLKLNLEKSMIKRKMSLIWNRMIGNLDWC